MHKFWSLAAGEERTDLYLLDEIAERESWFSDAVTPKAMKRDLDSARGTLYVWLDSPGGDAFAGAAIHDMLREYSASGRGRVVAMVSLAASAASIIAMAADEIRISPLGTIMIHEPWSQPAGKAAVLRAVADVLDTVREAQVDTYVKRTGQTREKILELLEGPDGNGTYMNARQSIELGFADALMYDTDMDDDEDEDEPDDRRAAYRQALGKARIAASIDRDDSRLRAMTLRAMRDQRIDSTELRANGIQASSLQFSEIDARAVLSAFLKSVANEADAAGSALSEAIVAGVRSGIQRYEQLTAQPGDGGGDPPQQDQVLQRLLSAINDTASKEGE